jgi:hypothetical protein
MIGQTFGNLTVVAQTKQKDRTLFVCECACGRTCRAALSRLKSGSVRSCGCAPNEEHVRTTHGRYHEPEYLAWQNMKKRCADPRYARWYGTVSICPQWLSSYEAFLADVGPRPSPRHSLDRINPAGDYVPDNVRWADRHAQSRNTKLHCTSKTGVRGVSWSKTKHKWRAAIYVNNKQTHVGYFATVEAAAAARKEAEMKLWGYNV